MPRRIKYRTFAESARDAAKRCYRDRWPAYVDACLGRLFSNIWLDRPPNVYDLHSNRTKPITRNLLWRALGDAGKPRDLWDWPEGKDPPWEKLAAVRPNAIWREWAERLAMTENNAREWVRNFAGAPDEYHSGLPGRPGIMHLILPELTRRAKAGELRPKVTDEARCLQEWFAGEHPQLPQRSARTIEQKIRAKYKKLRKRTK